ncbi:hypothetical protein FACS1894109_20760 [Spirochaetia bacterium]|nr:hypothetical protein FACS1894109_20760 [Spirochaetia bacterium]
MKGKIALLLFLSILSSDFYLEAQQGNSPARRSGQPYLIPQTVFVGDKARLVVPLGTAFTGASAFVLDNSAQLPPAGDIRVHRLELEHRGGSPQLLIDFTAFAPGDLELPPFPTLGIAGLTVNIASILDSGGEALVLSNPAPPLAAPGTLFIIYGTVTGIILILFAAIGGRIWGKRHLGAFREKWRRRRLIRAMGKIEGRIRLNLLKGNPGSENYAETLALLSGEFRAFLGYFSGLNCRAMTAGEFFDFPPLVPIAEGETGDKTINEMGPQSIPLAPVLTGEYLGTLFRGFDRLRFSGEGIEREDVIGILDGVKLFTDTLGQAVQSTAAVQTVPGTISTGSASALSTKKMTGAILGARS